MPVVHHTAICVRDIEVSLRFWRDGLGFQELMDHPFEGDWPTLLLAPTNSLRAVFLGDPATPNSGIVELVDLGDVPEGAPPGDRATTGVLVVSVFTDVEAVIDRLRNLDLGGEPRRVKTYGVSMAVVVDPDGVLVELVDTAAAKNLERP